MLSIKQIALRSAHAAGLDSVVRRSTWRRSQLSILCYHGVSLCDEHEALPALYVSPEFLQARLARIRAGGYNVVSLADGIAQLRAGTLPPRAVAITFDDGTRDFAEIVVPLLREYAMPATIYLATYYCDRPLPVFDTALHYVLWRGRTTGVDVGDLVRTGISQQSLPLDTPTRRDTAWSALCAFARDHEFGADDKDVLLRSVSVRVGVDYEEFLATGMFQQMTHEQVAALPRDLIDVQLHTHRHRTPRDRALFSREIVDNRTAIDALTGGTPTRHFCYPSGDYWGEFLDWLPAHGVETATTCVPGLASAKANPLLLPRWLDTSTTPDIVFDAWLSGVADLLPRKRVNRIDPARLASRGV